jgi:hypothetical protein
MPPFYAFVGITETTIIAPLVINGFSRRQRIQLRFGKDDGQIFKALFAGWWMTAGAMMPSR